MVGALILHIMRWEEMQDYVALLPMAQCSVQFYGDQKIERYRL